VDDPALKVDEIHRSVFHKMRSKQSKPRGSAIGVARDEANASPLESILLDCRHNLGTSDDGPYAEAQKGSEQPPPV